MLKEISRWLGPSMNVASLTWSRVLLADLSFRAALMLIDCVRRHGAMVLASRKQRQRVQDYLRRFGDEHVEIDGKPVRRFAKQHGDMPVMRIAELADGTLLYSQSHLSHRDDGTYERWGGWVRWDKTYDQYLAWGVEERPRHEALEMEYRLGESPQAYVARTQKMKYRCPWWRFW
jgi:hypothetical protein